MSPFQYFSSEYNSSTAVPSEICIVTTWKYAKNKLGICSYRFSSFILEKQLFAGSETRIVGGCQQTFYVIFSQKSLHKMVRKSTGDIKSDWIFYEQWKHHLILVQSIINFF